MLPVNKRVYNKTYVTKLMNWHYENDIKTV